MTAPVDDFVDMELPVGARFLSLVDVIARGGLESIEFYVEVDPEAPTHIRRFHVFATESPRVLGRYVGTARGHNGNVWHLYEQERKR